MTSILSLTGIETVRHNQPGRQIYGRASHILINHLYMCAGGMDPLSALKYAAADSTDMNLKLCALTGNGRSNLKLGVC